MRKHYRFCSTSSIESSSSDHDYLKSVNRINAKMAAAPISRRPVGGHAIHTNIPSRNSVATVYGDDYGFSLSPSYSHKAFDFGKSSADPPPPVPSKEEVSPLSENAPATPEGLPRSPTFGVVDPASSLPVQQSELWRRRSTKSDRNVEFSELKLAESNGSTAAPINNQLPPLPDKSLPALPKSVTGSTVRKAVPPRPPPQPDFIPNKPMGHKHSKERGSSPENKPVSPLSPTQTQAPFTRLPTPDYQSRDIQHPSNYIVSPISPSTPPQDELHLPPKIPQKMSSRENFSQIPRKAPSMETMKSAGARTNFSRPGGIRKSPSKQSLPSSAKASESQTVHKNKPSTPVISPASPASQKFRTSLQSPLSQENLQSIISPFNLPPPAAPGTVFSALPLNITHFQCYQKHKYMRSSKNTLCPVACQVCEKKDKERRWQCSWCSLRCCDGCMKVLARSKKDLMVTLGVIAAELEELEKQFLAGAEKQ